MTVTDQALLTLVTPVYEALKQSTCSSTLWFMILYNSFIFTCIMYVTKSHSKYVPWYSEQTVHITSLLVHHTVRSLWACGLSSSAEWWAIIKYTCRQILCMTAVLICVWATLSRNCFFSHFMQNRTKIKSCHCDKPYKMPFTVPAFCCSSNTQNQKVTESSCSEKFQSCVFLLQKFIWELKQCNLMVMSIHHSAFQCSFLKVQQSYSITGQNTTPCVVINITLFLIIKPTRCTDFSNLFLE